MVPGTMRRSRGAAALSHSMLSSPAIVRSRYGVTLSVDMRTAKIGVSSVLLIGLKLKIMCKRGNLVLFRSNFRACRNSWRKLILIILFVQMPFPNSLL